MEHRIPPVHQRVFGLYAVLDLPADAGPRAAPLAAALLAGGAGTIELRMRGASDRVLVETALSLGPVCQNRSTLIIHGRLDVALAVGADGVHFPQDGFPIREAHNVIQRQGFLIGLDAATDDEARAAMQGGASFICFGPIFPTPEGAGAVGMEKFSEICRWINVPLVAAGGITLDNVKAVAAVGPAALALDEAVTGAADPTAAARAVTEAFQRTSGVRAQRRWTQPNPR